MKIGKIDLTWLGHAGFMIRDSKSIYIDPYDLNRSDIKADIILITHSHYDHCSIADIEKIVKDGTVILLPADAQSKITRIKERIKMEVVEPGDSLNIGNVKIEGVPAYNVNKNFHLKQEGWLGYIIKIKNVIIYHAGDTDLIPEMQKLTGYGKTGNEFVALLPVGGTYTMNAIEAVESAKIIKPNLAIPIHWGSIVGSKEDAERFKELCKEAGIEAEILERR